MKHYIFKAPRKKDDVFLKMITFEPSISMVQHYAQKYGNIIILSQEELDNENRDNSGGDEPA